VADSNFNETMKTKIATLLTWLSASVVGLAQPVPHHFTGIATLPDRTISLSLDGKISSLFNLTGATSNQFMQMFDLYVVEASADLADWTRLALLLRTNSNPNPLVFQDTNAVSSNQRFYRTPTNHLITGFPKPRGPFAVGTLSRILTDSSRSNRYGLRTNSSFLSTFWYPAEPPGAGSSPGVYTDQAVAEDRNFYNYWGWSLQWTSAAPRLVAHSLPEAPSASGTNRFPVILHSHGWSCDRRLNSQNAEELASHGYIVAAVDHEDCHATVYPDARGARYVPPGSRADESNLGPSRLKDVQCLLDALGTMNNSDPLLAGRMDLERIGIMGFSAGGAVAVETCRTNSQVKCAALLDAYINFTFLPALNTQGLQKPFLAMNRTLLDHGLADYSPAGLRLYSLATQEAIWVKIDHTGHFSFTDFAWSIEMTAESRQAALAIDGCLVWFFDTYLKGEAPPFPTNAEIYNVQRK